MKYLAVDGDIELAHSEAAAWAKLDIAMDLAVNMTQGIEKLLENNYLYVGINSDTVDFLPLLKIMRSVTSIPIFIITANFTTEMEVAALERGADLFARRHKNSEGNIASVLAHITRLNERSKNPCPPSNIIIYNNLLIAPLQQCVYANNQKIMLTEKECGVLYLLMNNNGCVFSPKEIYSKVWKAEYNDSAKVVIWKIIKNLRRKINNGQNLSKYITTLRDTGYSFNPE